MSLNWKEIDLALSELDLEGAFIQQIVQPGYDSLALYTYRQGTARTVFISLGAGVCRIHETWKAVPKNSKPLRFMEFLRSRVKGSKIQSVSQLGQERIILMKLSHGEEQFKLYIRLWSGAANIIVADTADTILDTFYRRPARGETTGGHFEPPQWKNTPDEKALAWTVRQYEGYGSFCRFLDEWYGEHAENLSREALLEQAERHYTARRTKMEAALCRLEEKRNSFLNADKWKHRGDLILAFGYLLDSGGSELECEDYETGRTVRICINPNKTVQENAADCYAIYKKAVSGLGELEADIAQAKQELLDLDAVYASFKNEPNPLKLQQLLRKQLKPKQQQEKKYPGLAFDYRGWTILVGRTAAENDELLRRHVKGQDMWLHTRDWAGGYVFIKNNPGKTVPLEILIAAGNLAVYHSKGRRAGTADLYYTQVKYLRRAKNSPKGLVLPTHEKNLCISLDQALIRQIETTLRS